MISGVAPEAMVVHAYQRRSSPDPCSEIVKLITCVVADKTLDGGGVLCVRDSELLCDPRCDISIFHERVFDKAVLEPRQPMSKYYSAVIKLAETAYLIHLLAFVMKRKPTVLLGLVLAVLEAVVDFECNFLLVGDLLRFECIEHVLLDEEES